MNLLGCVNYPPDMLFSFLKKRVGIDRSDVIFIADNQKLTKRSAKKVYVFVSAKAARRNLEEINSPPYKGKLGFICDAPLNLYGFSGIGAFDYSEALEIHLDAFLLERPNVAMLKREEELVSFEKQDYAERVLERIESFTGILTQFMTFVYTMPSATHQKPVKELACSWWSGDWTIEFWKAKVTALAKALPMNDRQRTRMFDLTTSDSSMKYKAALAEAKLLSSMDCEEFTAVAAKHSVSAYEMRYILSVAGIAPTTV